MYVHDQSYLSAGSWLWLTSQYLPQNAFAPAHAEHVMILSQPPQTYNLTLITSPDYIQVRPTGRYINVHHHIAARPQQVCRWAM